MKKFAIMFSLLLAAVPVLAGPPQSGVYLSTDMGGSMLPGRFSESFVDPGSHGQVGNTIHALSYDMSGLGTQWKLTCASIVFPPSVVADTRVSGTGEVTYRTEYIGMVRLAYTLVGSNAEAEDLVQDSFVEVARRLDEIRKPGAYLRSAVVSRCRSVLRRRRVFAPTGATRRPGQRRG